MFAVERLNPVIGQAQESFANLLKAAIAQGPISVAQYVRYLSMQYHLTKGVQRYFITAAAHADLQKKHALRKWLLDFANEEELHYVVAGKDLQKLGYEPLPEPFDVTLWHSYFREIVVTRPFVRLGAACVLENLSGGVARQYVKQALSAPFLNRDNSNFLVIHQHEKLPHGEQIIAALTRAQLNTAQVADVVEGAKKGTVLYMRMAEWALDLGSLSSLTDAHTASLTVEDLQEISQFEMTMLELPTH